jgi:hypothetical protein
MVVGLCNENLCGIAGAGDGFANIAPLIIARHPPMSQLRALRDPESAKRMRFSTPPRQRPGALDKEPRALA